MDRMGYLTKVFLYCGLPPDERDELLSYGPAIVYPLLKAHEAVEYGSSDYREAIILLLSRMRSPLLGELTDYLTYGRVRWVRITAFEVLAERAMLDMEDLGGAIALLESLRNDSNSRIRDNVEGRIQRIRETMEREPRTCEVCGRISRYYHYSFRTGKLCCAYCLP